MAGTGMGFGVNSDIHSKMDIIAKLIKDAETQRNKEWLGDAVIKVIDGKKDKGNYNLTAFSSACEKNTKTAQAKKGDVAIVDEQELVSGYTILEPEDVTAANYFDKAERNADAAHYVKEFKDMREYILLERKNDIWRLLQLSLQNDKKAQCRLRQIVEDETFF